MKCDIITEGDVNLFEMSVEITGRRGLGAASSQSSKILWMLWYVADGKSSGIYPLGYTLLLSYNFTHDYYNSRPKGPRHTKEAFS